jgi:hypothetical protein
MKTMLRVIFLASCIAIASCSSKSDFDKGKKLLEQQGYTDVNNTGYSIFCCDEKDTFSTGFACKDRNGDKVSGCFCSSYLKALTIRFE